MSQATADLQARLRQAFETSFGGAPSQVVQAPGRVNLIGEHTDYNDGFVLPCAIDFQTQVAWRPRSDGQVRLVAADLGGARDAFSVDEPLTPNPQSPWADYVRGVVQQLQLAGRTLQGCELAIAGNVPRGAGLSSSAALEVAVAQALLQRHGWADLSPTQLAQLAQRAENDFVGCHCGIMDQLISACGDAGHALLIDCRSLHTQAVAMPANTAVMIVHSHVRRGLVDSPYNLRRQQCEAAALHLGVPALRDASLALLAQKGAGLGDEVHRRARHVITENERTLQAAQALQAGDLVAMGQLMAASHASMRDDFEITVPAIDQLVQILKTSVGAQGGARMTGGGFGGCAVALLPQAEVARVQAQVLRQYRSPQGQAATVWVCQPSSGAGPL
jgi:galactokinase